MDLRTLLASMGAVALLASSGWVSRGEVRAVPVALGSLPTSGQIIEITAREYRIDWTATAVHSGKLAFIFRNAGDETHEMAVVPYDHGEYGLPVAEIEAVPPGHIEALQVDLKPGSYRIVCLQMTSSGRGSVSHMSIGMEALLEVLP
jgi:hypothetical protein